MKSLVVLCLLVGVAFALPVFDSSSEFDGLSSNSPSLADDAVFGGDNSDENFAGRMTYSSSPVFRSGYNVVSRKEDDDDDDDDDDDEVAAVRAYYARAPAVSQQKSLGVQTYSVPVATYSAPTVAVSSSAPMSYAAPTMYSVPQPSMYSVAHPTTYSVRTAVPSSGTSFYTVGSQPTYFRSSDDSVEVSSYFSGTPTVYSAPQDSYSAPQVSYSAPQVSYSAPRVVSYSAPTFYSSAHQGYVYYGGDDDDDDRFDFD